MADKKVLSPEEEILRQEMIKYQMRHLFWKNDERLKYKEVYITDAEFKALDEFAWKVAEYKKKEQADTYKDKSVVWMHNTFLIGICAEWGVLKHTNHSWDVLDIGIGRVKSYTEPDLRYAGLPFGVKSSKIGNAPMVYPDHKQDEIICAAKPYYGKQNEETGEYIITKIWKIYICGIATAEVIRKYQSPDYILNKNTEQSKVKNGFYGYDYLEPLKDLYAEVLCNIVEKNSK
jgi:hypothetical protein